MGDPTSNRISSEEGDPKLQSGEKKKEDENSDPEWFSCLLQPAPPDSDPKYIGIRRILLHRKEQAGVLRRKGWRCNGKGYVAYRNYINRPRNEESSRALSFSSTAGHSGRWVPSPSPLPPFIEADNWSSSRDIRNVNQALSHRTSFSSNASEINASDVEYPPKKGEPAYSFVGMHCIFDQCKAMVTVIKFGHMSSNLLAYGASDGSLTVCIVSTPPSIQKQLIGHSKDVTENSVKGFSSSSNSPWVGSGHVSWKEKDKDDFDFSANNQYIASASIDKTVRVWDISKGVCMRVIYGISSQLCIRFHPMNNNFLSAGNANKEILVFNFSTGRTINKSFFDSEVTAMDHDHTGQLIFCGDAQGCVYTVTMNTHTGALSRSHRHRSKAKQKSPVTTVQYRTFSLLARGPVLLTLCRDGSLSFFSVSLEVQGYLTLRCALKLTPRLHNIRASFCPLLSLEKGEYIVAGSEDANVYFYDLTRPRHTCVNKLQGHSFPVIGIAWNYGENFLASSDFGGTVIVWKRAKTN